MPQERSVAEVLSAPASVSSATWAELTHTPCDMTQAALHEAAWVATVCKHRTAFANTCFVLEQLGADLFYKFVYAMQSPRLVVFAPLLVAEPALQLVDVTGENWEEVATRTWRHEFHASWLYFKTSEELPQLTVDRISVLKGLVHVGGQRVCSDFEPVPLQKVLEELLAGELPAATARNAGQTMPRGHEGLLLQFPWLTGTLEAAAAPPLRGARAAVGTDAHRDGQPRYELSDLDIEGLFSALRAAREEAAEESVEGNDFRVRVLGGTWAATHKGVAFDAYRGEPAGEQALQFLEAQGLPKSARFDVSLYTAPGAALLARTWCDKCQYWYDIATANENHCHEFTEVETKSWEEPQGFTDLALLLQGPALQRWQWLHNLQPGRCSRV